MRNRIHGDGVTTGWNSGTGRLKSEREWKDGKERAYGEGHLTLRAI